MGLVYPESDIPQNIPRKPHLGTIARRMYCDGSRRLYDNNKLISMQLYGSVSTASESLRSDLDVLFILPHSHNRRDVRKLVHEVHNVTRFQPETNALTLREVRLHTYAGHTLDRIFYSLIKNSPREGNVVGLPPEIFIKPPQEELENLLKTYIRTKKRKFSDAFITPQTEVRYKELQRALELPVSLGRKIIGVHAVQNPTLPEHSRVMSKKDIIQTMQLLLAEYPVAQQNFNLLLELDFEYTHLLEQVLSEKISKDEYRRWITYNHTVAMQRALDVLEGVEGYCQENF